jgi:hypothetical protein
VEFKLRASVDSEGGNCSREWRKSIAGRHNNMKCIDTAHITIKVSLSIRT